MAEWKKVIVSGSSAHIANLDVDSAVTASYFVGDGSGLTNLPGTSLNIDDFSALGSAGLHQTEDHFVFSDNGTEKKITFSNLEDSIFANVSGDATIAGGGALTIANDAVELGMLNDAAFSVTASGDVTGEAALSGDKVALSLTIANGAIDAGMITDATTGSILNTIAGDVNVTAGGVSTIQANAIDLGMLNDAAFSITASGDLTGEAALSSDKVALALTIASNAVEESMINTSVAGTGLSGGGGSALSVDYGTSAGTAAQGNTSVTFNGTANEIELSTNNFTSIGGGGTVTIGLPNDVTIGNNLTVTGDLTVSGDNFVANVTNLNIDDKYILLNSGSASGDSGIIFGGSKGNANQGMALILDDSDDRLKIANFEHSGSHGSDIDFSGVATHLSVAGVFEGTAGNATSAGADKVGNLRVESSEIYIYV